MGRRILLANWLNRADCQTVKIGCSRGSSFIYCGPINEEMYEVLEKENKRQLKRRGELQARKERLLREISDIDCELSQPEDVLSRPVMDAYPSIAENGQMIVEIDGIWSGRFWDIEEYENAKKKEAANDF